MVQDPSQSTSNGDVDQSSSSTSAPSATSTFITMIKYVIVAALMGLVAGRSIEETKVDDRIAAEKSTTGLEDSAAATRSYNADKKKPYATRDDYDDAGYGHDQPLNYKYNYQVKDDSSYNFQDKYEETDGAGVVHGRYSLRLPDGRVQEVTYTVDKYSGYVPVVKYIGQSKYPVDNYDKEYDEAYKGGYQKGYQAGGKYGYQSSKPAYKKPHYWVILITTHLLWFCTQSCVKILGIY